MSMQLARAKAAFGKPFAYSPYPQPSLESVPRQLACRPALYNPDHLDRVTRCAFDKTLPQMVEVMEARHYTEGPLSRYRLGEATVIGGTIFTGCGPICHSLFVKTSAKDAFRSYPVHDSVILANSMPGLRYFGHWLSDDVSAFEAYRGNPALMSLPLPSWSDIATYSTLFEHEWDQHMSSGRAI